MCFTTGVCAVCVEQFVYVISSGLRILEHYSQKSFNAFSIVQLNRFAFQLKGKSYLWSCGKYLYNWLSFLEYRPLLSLFNFILAQFVVKLFRTCTTSQYQDISSLSNGMFVFFMSMGTLRSSLNINEIRLKI